MVGTGNKAPDERNDLGKRSFDGACRISPHRQPAVINP